MPGARTRSVLLALAAAFAPPAPARADGGLLVVPLEGGSWAEQIAAVQAAPRPAGVVFRVRVVEDDTGRPVACGRYALAVDADAARGLRFGACDPATGATEVVLTDRAALFAPGDPVPLPRPVAVSAAAVREGATAGGAAPVAGVEMRCTAAVRPYVADLLRGTQVYLTPDRYRLEPLDGGARAEAGREAWVITATRAGGAAEAAFRVVDARDGREVVRSRVALRCAASDPAAAAAARARAPRDVPRGTAASPFRLPAGAVGRGSTTGGEPERLSCADVAAPTVVWRFVAPADGPFEFLLQGGFDTALEVRGGAPGAARALGCNDDDGPNPTHSRVVARLVRGQSYDIAVSGTGGEAGRYELAAIALPLDVELRAEGDAVRVVRVEP